MKKNLLKKRDNGRHQTLKKEKAIRASDGKEQNINFVEMVTPRAGSAVKDKNEPGFTDSSAIHGNTNTLNLLNFEVEQSMDSERFASVIKNRSKPLKRVPAN